MYNSELFITGVIGLILILIGTYLIDSYVEKNTFRDRLYIGVILILCSLPLLVNGLIIIFGG